VKISKTQSDGATTLTVAGEVDVAWADQVREAGLAALREAGCLRLTLELSGVTFLDSTGLSALIAIKNAADTDQLPFTLANPTRAVTKILQITGVEQIFTITTDPDASEPVEPQI
jgi:anti-sigma B factor antagonist